MVDGRKATLAMVWRSGLLLLLAGLLNYVDGQSDFYRDRFYSRIRCHTCEADFSNTRYRADDPCLIGDRGKLADGSRDIALCSRNVRFCKAEVSRQLGLLVTFQRSCAEECTHSCSTKGFGIVRETCIYCCTSDPSCSENPEKRRINYARPNRTHVSYRRTSSNSSASSAATARSVSNWVLSLREIRGTDYTGVVSVALLAAIGSLLLRY
ncbi:uncharacterized protein LOC111244459 isoform X1 [Varroa destructor]|uniref:Uncharacterized protein n=1 Tax=Varroa destructor TaxID=109461 RepID=A0A7M7JGA2_VARDE|nr:uncharacterized protein LOC111244459 isoform X1 [Varroa destructor]